MIVMLAWFVDKVLPALVVFAVTTPVTMLILNRKQTSALKDHVDTMTDVQTDELKKALEKTATAAALRGTRKDH